MILVLVPLRVGVIEKVFYTFRRHGTLQKKNQLNKHTFRNRHTYDEKYYDIKFKISRSFRS